MLMILIGSAKKSSIHESVHSCISLTQLLPHGRHINGVQITLNNCVVITVLI